MSAFYGFSVLIAKDLSKSETLPVSGNIAETNRNQDKVIAGDSLNSKLIQENKQDVNTHLNRNSNCLFLKFLHLQRVSIISTIEDTLLKRLGSFFFIIMMDDSYRINFFSLNSGLFLISRKITLS